MSGLENELRKLEKQNIPTEQYKKLQDQFESLVEKGKKLSESLKNTEKYEPTKAYAEAEKSLDTVSAKQDHLNKKMQEWVELGKSKNSTSYKKMELDFANLEKESSRLIARLNEMDKNGQDKQVSEKWAGIKAQMEQVGHEASKVKAQMRELEGAGKSHVDVKDTEEYQKKASQLRDANAQYAIASKKLEEYAQKQSKAGTTGNRAFGLIRKSLSGIHKLLSGMTSLLGKVGGAAKGFFSKFTSGGKKSRGVLDTFASRLKGLAMSLLIFNGISKAFRTMIEDMKAGIQSYAKSSGTFNQTMSEFKTSTENLKNAVGVAVTPIVNAFVPALVTLCNWLTQAANMANQLISALTGKTTWSQAKDQQVNYAKSLDKTASSAKKATGALAGFDDLNVLQKNDDSGSGTGSKEVEYEEVPISDAANNLKDILEGQDWTSLGALFADKLNQALQNIPWDVIQQGAKDIGLRLATLINGFVANADWNLIGYTVGQGINTALIFANTFLSTVNWLAIGSSVADAINSMFETIDWALLGQTVANGFNMVIDTLYGFVHELDWALIGESIGTSLQETFSNIHWENIGKAFSDGAIGIFTALREALAQVDWQQLGHNVADMIKAVNWNGVADAVCSGVGAAFGAFAGFLQGLIEDAWKSVVNWWRENAYKDGEFTIEGLLEGIGNALSSIGDWISEHIFQPFMDGFREVFGIHSPSTVMEEMGFYLIEGLKNGLIGIWDKVKSIIDGFKTNIKVAFNSVKSNTVSIFTAMKNSVFGIFNGMWEGIKGVINTILTGVEKMANGVVNAINTVINALNSLKFDLPDWLPGDLAGKSFGLNIPNIPAVSIPKLATGGVTVHETLAKIGEAGREAVLPLENNTGWMDDLADKLVSRMPEYNAPTEVVLAMDGKEVARAQVPYLHAEEVRLGIAPA